MPDLLGNILVIDDEADVRETLDLLLRHHGFSAGFAPDAEKGLAALQETPYDLLLLDLNLPGRNGLEVLQEIRRRDSSLPVIVLTAMKDIDIARAAFKSGAQDYIPKPWDADELLAQIHRALERRRLAEENRQLRRALRERYSFTSIVGKSETMLKLLDLVEQVAPTRSTVLIHGESGTGKELIAKAIHNASPRKDKLFVPVNTGTMPVDLLESILFGHVKGAFTHAIASKKGLFEVADQGTLFFDEIGTIGVDTQAKLLRVMQEREFMRLGGTETVKVDVRILAATNVELKTLVADGRFRDDLFYRLNVIALELPPLRSRREDIPLLVEHFTEKYCQENGKPARRFSPEALRRLAEYSWPGNVRELENAIERAIVLAQQDTMGPELLPPEISGAAARAQLPAAAGAAPGLFDILDDYERQIIRDALERAGGSQTEAARALQVPLSTLNQKIKRLDIETKRSRRNNTA